MGGGRRAQRTATVASLLPPTPAWHLPSSLSAVATGPLDQPGLGGPAPFPVTGARLALTPPVPGKPRFLGPGPLSLKPALLSLFS